ncbi:lytic polysaccharide monooxygenase [Nonomuraea sp. NPDC050404]|uniref:lytic polysaccharide monooxygenase auxiliary activity family 9 protein n=1 Tax=Nonomuraea sp. NPDC050404 TaxID=3155783 RepID=UPI0033CE640D
MWHRVGFVIVTLLPSVVMTVMLTVLAIVPAGLMTARPAGAHGGLESPLSRAAACGAEGPRKAVRSVACRAAVRASAGALPARWDDLRVSYVAGRDRTVIRDGALCSGGLAAFKGLDLARADWPATTLRAKARFAFKYRGTIPHRGTFRLYVTRKGYDPSSPLRWSDLERRPFLKVTDPKLTDGSYTFEGRLPNRTGRHLIYTIWQNSDTPDTYYSCSDVVFTRAAASASSGSSSSSGQPAPPARPASVTRQSSVTGDRSWLVGGAVVLAGVLGVAGLAALRLTTRASRGRHR